MIRANNIVECTSIHQQCVSAYYTSLFELAGEDGIYWDGALKGWVIVKYEPCSKALYSKKLTADRLDLPRGESGDLVEAAEGILNSQMMFSSSEVSTRKASQWSSYLQEGTTKLDLSCLVTEMIEEIALHKKFDAYETFLKPYISRVIFGQFGFSETERLKLLPFVNGYVKFLDGKVKSEKEFELSMYSIVALYSKIAQNYETIPKFKGYERHAWISDLILTLAAGHDSAAYLLATVLINTHVNNQIEDLNSSRLLTEALRFDNPVQLIGRKVIEDFSIGGKVFVTGEKLYLHIGTANRDPDVFNNPHIFDSDRETFPILSFGLGEKQCLGRSLAVQSARLLLDSLLSRNAWINIDLENVVRASGSAGRGFKALPAEYVEW